MNEVFNEFARLLENRARIVTEQRISNTATYSDIAYYAREAQTNTEKKQLERMKDIPIPIYGHCGSYESDNATAMLCKHCGKSKYFHGNVSI